MFRIKHVSMYQWHQYRKLRLPFTRLVCLISGPNGSGKTTILDGIRVCLGCGVSRKRTLRGYLSLQSGPALIRLIVTNPKDEARGRHTWQAANPALKGDEVTIACWVRNVGAAAPDRRFLILPGRVEENQIEALFQDKQGIDVTDFHRALKAIGMEVRVIERLIIEQGRIGEVAAMEPHERYKLVEAQLMEPETIRRFEEALKKLRDAETEITRQKERLAVSMADLLLVETQKQRRAKYDNLIERRDEAQVEVWIAKLQGTIETQAAAEAQLEDRRPRLPIERAALAQAERDLGALLERVKEFQANETQFKKELSELDTWKTTTSERMGQIRLMLRDIETDGVTLIGLPTTSIEEASAARQALVEQADAARVAVLQQESEVERLNDEVNRLTRNEPLIPPEVMSVWSILEQQRIPVILVKDVIRPGSLPPTLENALGDLRFGIITTKEAFARVCKIAQANAYPGPVYSGERRGGESAGVALTNDAPRWLAEYVAGIQFKKDSWTDARGTWFNKTTPILHGPSLKAQLEEKKVELARARVMLAERQQLVTDLKVRLEQADARLATAKERVRLLERVALKSTLEEERKGLQAELDAKQPRLDELRRRVFGGEVERSSLGTRKKELEARRDTHKANIRAIELDIANAETTLKEALEIQQEVKKNLTPGQQARVTGRRLSVQASETRFETIVDELNEINTIDLPGEDVYDKYTRMDRAVTETREGLERVERARGEYEEETSASRLAYMSRANSALARYRDRVKELCKFVNMEPDMAIPIFTEKTTNDEIERAEIHLRFRFGEEPWRKSGDGTFSGGQTVLQGLIQLMALAELNKDAFFIVDEPYAHLSIDRIDQVATFLETSGPQFIVTAPTGLNKDLFGSATQVIVASPKRDGEKFLPHPALGSEDILHA